MTGREQDEGGGGGEGEEVKRKGRNRERAEQGSVISLTGSKDEMVVEGLPPHHIPRPKMKNLKTKGISKYHAQQDGVGGGKG